MIKGGIVLVDPTTGNVLRVVPLQYNPETIARTLQVQGVGADTGPHVDQLRLKGPPIETIKLEAEFDGADLLYEQDATIAKSGIAPLLATLELILYPTSAQLQTANSNAQNGTLEIIPMDAPLALFVWSKARVVPVRFTDFSITEEMFDSALNPIRAKVSLGMRVLTIDDLTFTSIGGSIYMAYQQQKEQLAQRVAGGNLAALGIGSIP